MLTCHLSPAHSRMFGSELHALLDCCTIGHEALLMVHAVKQDQTSRCSKPTLNHTVPTWCFNIRQRSSFHRDCTSPHLYLAKERNLLPIMTQSSFI